MMSFFSNQQNMMAAGLVALWLAWAFGPAVVEMATGLLSRLKSEVWPKVSSKTNVLSAWPLLGIALIYAIPAMTRTTPVPEPIPVREPDIMDKCQVAERSLLAEEVKEFAGQKFDSVKAAEDAMNEKILDIVLASYKPVFVEINESRKDGTLPELADKIAKGELR